MMESIYVGVALCLVHSFRIDLGLVNIITLFPSRGISGFVWIRVPERSFKFVT
jgi:hypothetical protein